MNKEFKSDMFCVRRALGVPEKDYYDHLAMMLTEHYVAESFTYILATEHALYYLALGGAYTPYEISHKKKAFKEAVGTVGIKLGARRRAQIPVKIIKSTDDKLLMCKGQYRDSAKVVSEIILVN